MNKIIISTGILLIGILVYFVSGQPAAPEVTGVYLFDAMPLAGNGTGTNSCMAGASAPCIDTDNGYNPAATSQVAANLLPMTYSLIGPLTVWGGVGPYQCLMGNEICIVNGNLLEFVCGSSVGIPTGATFTLAFPNNLWSGIGEPVAVIEVNCAGYAANNPGLGLTGVCATVPGTSFGYCA